jgi:Zn-dependent peptidase ImmA (M78 family)
MLSPYREKKIKELAEYISLEYFPQGKVQPEALAKSKGITFSYGNYEDNFDGMLQYKDGRFHIFLNKFQLRPERIRFTFAHELGHYFIDEHRNSLENELVAPHRSIFSEQNRHIAELEADFFASNLLMPPSLFKKEAQKHPLGLAAIQQLSNAFDTSWLSTAMQYIRNNTRPCLLVRWNVDGSHWAISSFSLQQFLDFPPRIVLAQLRGSATRAAKDEPSSGTPTIVKGSTTLNVWIPSITSASFKNLICTEEALKLGQYGGITLVFPST